MDKTPETRGFMPPRPEEIASPKAILRRMKERLALSAVSRILTPKIYKRVLEEYIRRITIKR